MSQDLRKPQEITVNPLSIIVGSFIFAIIFFAIGSLWRYYLVIGA